MAIAFIPAQKIEHETVYIGKYFPKDPHFKRSDPQRDWRSKNHIPFNAINVVIIYSSQNPTIIYKVRAVNKMQLIISESDQQRKKGIYRIFIISFHFHQIRLETDWMDTYVKEE